MATGGGAERTGASRIFGDRCVASQGRGERCGGGVTCSSKSYVSVDHIGVCGWCRGPRVAEVGMPRAVLRICRLYHSRTRRTRLLGIHILLRCTLQCCILTLNFCAPEVERASAATFAGRSAHSQWPLLSRFGVCLYSSSSPLRIERRFSTSLSNPSPRNTHGMPTFSRILYAFSGSSCVLGSDVL